MTTIAVVTAAALLVAVATLAIVQAVRGAEHAVSGSEVGKLTAVLAAGSREREVLLRVLAAAVFALVAAVLWHTSDAAAALSAWSEAALPVWAAWLV